MTFRRFTRRPSFRGYGGLGHVPAPIALGALERWLSTQGVTAPSNKVSAWLGSLNGIVASQATAANRMDYVANSANLGGPALIPADGLDFVETGSVFTDGELYNGLTVFIYGYCPPAMAQGSLCYTRDPATGTSGRSGCNWRADDAGASAASVSTDLATFVQVVRSTFAVGKIWILYSYAPGGTLRARSSAYAAASAAMPAEAVTPIRFSIGSVFGAGAVAFEYSEVVLFDRQLNIADEDRMAAYGASLL